MKFFIQIIFVVLLVSCGADESSKNQSGENSKKSGSNKKPLDPNVPASFIPNKDETLAPIDMKKDEGFHNKQTEWWYYTGHFKDKKSGKTYGFEQVIFLARYMGAAGLMGHTALSDENTKKFYHVQKLALKMPKTVDGGFELDVPGNFIKGSKGTDILKAKDKNYSYDLVLKASKPVIFHGGDGIITMANGFKSYYYSRTRMMLSGSFELDGEKMEVEGMAWMDHQWGDFQTTSTGWDWFSIQLENRTELMIFIIPNIKHKNQVFSATYIDKNGKTTEYGNADVEIKALKEWKSPHTDGTYPISWSVKISKLGLDLTLNPSMEDQEVYKRVIPQVPIYWEGSHKVTGTLNSKAIKGSAYTESVGYATKILEKGN